MITPLLALAPLALPVLSDLVDDWPGWRGPHGDGAAQGSPPLVWSEDQNVRWKTPIPGKGLSSPVVLGDRVFLTTAIALGEAPQESGESEPQPEAEGDRRGRGGFGRMRSMPLVKQQFVVIALDRADGSILWKQVAREQTPHESSHADGSFASPTLVTDGERLIAFFGSYGLYAYDLEGEPLWEQDLGDMNIMRSFGEGSSPVLHDGVLCIQWEHEGESFVVALDAATGEERWRQPRSRGTSWASPLLIDSESGPLVVVSGLRTVAYELRSGEERWSYGKAPEAPAQTGDGRRRGGGGGGGIASPVHSEGILVLVSGGRRGSFKALSIDGEPEGELSDESALMWTHPGDTPNVPTPLVHDGILYALKGNSGLLGAFDMMSGAVMYGERLTGVQNVYASPVVADEHIYIASRDGTVEVVAAGPDFESLAVNQLDDAFDASPAIAGDEIFLRGLEYLYCIASEE